MRTKYRTHRVHRPGFAARVRTASRPDTAELLREVERLHAMLDTNSDWIWEVDAQGRYTYASRHALTLLGYAPSEIVGRTPFDFMPPDEAARVAQAFGAIVAEKRPFAGLINRNRHRDGRIVVLETSGVPLLAPDGSLRGYRGIDRDVTAQEAERQRLRVMARHDDLTGLGNRLALREHLEAALGDRREGADLTVFLLDLDLFKSVNDSLGHGAGDLLLVEVSRRLGRATSGLGAQAFRLGGDEFVVVSADERAEAGERCLHAITDSFVVPFVLDGVSLCVSASVGVAEMSDHRDTPESLLAKADAALYRHKTSRRRPER